MIKCGVCGSENEAAALFCGVCGSPLPRQDAAPPTEAVPVPPPDTAAVTPPPPPETGDTVVPGQNRARRDLGVGESGTASQGLGGRAETAAVTPEPEPDPGGPTVVCQVCGTINDATRTYCRKCANELKPMAAPPPPPPDPTPARKLSPVAIGLGAAAAVVAIALIGVLVFGGGGVVTPSASPGLSAVLPTLPPAASQLPTEPPVTEPPFTEGDPTGSIAFARCDGAGTGRCRIFLIDPENPSDVEPVTVLGNGSATDPALSSDGTFLLYSLPTGLRLLEVGSDDPINQSTTAGDLNSYWSPDDADIVFSGRRNRDPGSDDADREIRFDGAANGEVRDSEPLTQNAIEDHDPIITPDGLSVIWVQGAGDERELKIMNLDTRDEDDLTSDEFNDVDPAISPDGTTLAFASTRSSSDGTYDLFLLDIETKVITPLPPIDGDEHDPWWSPGGRYLVFSGGTDEDRDLWILDLADNSVDQLTSTGDRDLTPSWR